MKLVPDISAPIFTTSAFIIGLILCDDLTPAEQNSLGGWFMLIGQTMSTNSAQQQLLNNRNNSSSNYNSNTINDNNLRESANNIKNEINNIFKNCKEQSQNKF